MSDSTPEFTPRRRTGSLVLVVLVLGVTLGAILLRNRFRKKYRW